MIKMTLGLESQTYTAADLTPVIKLASYLYAGAWHQPLTYIELLLNRNIWNSLNREQRSVIELSARAATLSSLADSLEIQAASIEVLGKNGALIMRWPEGLLRVLRKARNDCLYQRANILAASGDDSCQRVLLYIDGYIADHAIYSDFRDINQGETGLPSALPK